MKKKLLFIFVVVVMLITIAIIYLNKFFFPVKFKEIIIQKAEDYLDRQVKFDSITFNPIKGLIIRNLSIADRDSPDLPFIQIKELNLTVLYAPILREKKIIIPSIFIDDPSVYVTRKGLNEWNFSDLLNKSRDPNEEKSPFAFFLGGVEINSGDIVLLDKTVEPNQQETFEETNGKISLSVTEGIRFSLESTLPKSSSYFSASGSANLEMTRIDGEFNCSNLQLAKYLALYPVLPQIEMESGTIKLAQGRIQKTEESFHMTAQISAEETSLVVLPDQKISGDLFAESIEIGLDPAGAFQVKGIVKLNNGQIHLGETASIAGNIEISQMSFTSVEKGKPQEIRADLLVKKGRADFGLHHLEGGISLTQGQLLLTGGGLDLNGNLKADDFMYQWTDGVSLSGQLSATPFFLNSADGNVTIKGSPQLAGGQIHLEQGREIEGNILFNELRLLYTPQGLTASGKLDLSDGVIAWDDKKFNGRLLAPRLELKTLAQAISVDAHLELKESALVISPDQTFEGDPVVDLVLNYDPASEKTLTYSGSLWPRLRSASGMPYAGEVKNIDGQVDFRNNFFALKDLRLFAFDSSLNLNGTIEGTDDPFCRLDITTDWMDIDRVFSLIPALVQKIPIVPEGRTKLSISFAGQPSSFDQAALDVHALIDDTKITSDGWPAPISGINGELDYSKDQLSWKNLQGNFQDHDFVLSGQLNDFKNPEIQTTLQSNDLGLSADTQLKMSDKAIALSSLKGKFHHSDFDVHGQVKLADAGPNVDLKGMIDLDSVDLEHLPSGLKQKLAELKPAGMIHWDGVIEGPIRDWKNLKLEFLATSSRLSMSGYAIDDIRLKYDQFQGKLNSFDLTAQVYDGKLIADGMADFQKERLPYEMNLNLTRTDLTKVKEATSWKDKDVSGFLSSVARLKGSLTDPDQLTGEGSIVVNEGNILELNLFKGLGKLLLIPEYEDIAFKEASSEFKISDQKIRTNNLNLISEPVTIAGKGWIGFDGTINLDLVSEFNPNTIAESESMKRTITSLIARTGQFMNIKISGTLKNPSHRVLPSPMNVIDKTKDLLLEGIQSIF